MPDKPSQSAPSKQPARAPDTDNDPGGAQKRGGKLKKVTPEPAPEKSGGHGG